MNIDLKPEQQRVIDLAVRSGADQNAGEVLDQAFEIIREQFDLEDWMLEQRDSVAAHIEKGFMQAERGELMDGDVALEMLRKRRAESRQIERMVMRGIGARIVPRILAIRFLANRCRSWRFTMNLALP
ncbi:MAG: hypothetical protein WBY44_25870 [Bryobacteraceae bacterium]|jgi:antitoxin ParD1/3/4